MPLPTNSATPSTPTTAMAQASQNPLVSNARASDNAPTVQLHPLVLLTISDCITRHTLRQQTGPVVGAIIGQQNGQEITMEVAFQAKLKANDDGDVMLDEEWFNKRTEDCECLAFASQGQAPFEAAKLTCTSQGCSQTATTRHRRLVHTRTSLRTTAPRPPHPLTYLTSLHRVATASAVPPRRGILRGDRCRQASAHTLRASLRECRKRPQ